ncbi:DUF427 domain-containing protein [Nocardiopsis exhalans]|uniref:DUF427 domain-containing protein n=1 Tax=Nocardiopsis exhalans TaxID=163604 RepID=A0ABY5D2S5_9ACTN|nr:DUF427 domain-containing protein [Nocardiopsis exhalans]USY17725.1 DUF427 domain-containing protein [Nocardiopsis exhalans]
MAQNGTVPGPDHPIDIEPARGRVVVRVGARVVARSSAALTLREASYPEVQYVPLADVDPAVLRPSPTTTHCPYKGNATYYTLEVGDGVQLPDALWTYEEPYPWVAEITDHAAFYPDRAEIVLEP